MLTPPPKDHSLLALPVLVCFRSDTWEGSLRAIEGGRVVKLGFKKHRNTILAAALGTGTVLAAGCGVMRPSSVVASSTTATGTGPQATVPPQSPIPLKFFGFANQPGEPKKVFLSKGEDVFIASEGEIVDRRYEVVRISPTSVDIRDVVGSGPVQSLPLV